MSSWLLLAFFLSTPPARAVDEYWRTDGTSGRLWTSNYWNNTPTPTGGLGWTSGANAFFTANSSLTYVSSTLFSNITLSDSTTVTVVAAGTAPANAHTYDIGTGSLLTWASQSFTPSGTSFVKNGAGTWDIGAIGGAYSGGFSLNAGTVIVSGNNSLGAGILTINGGTIQSSGTRAFAASSLVIGGNFTLTGTGASSWAGNVDLGSSNRTITNNAVGSGVTRTFGGTIFGSPGVGLTIEGTGPGSPTTSSTTILSAPNTFSGGTTLNGGGVLQLSANGTLGSTFGTLTVNAGRLDLNGTSQAVGNLTGNGGTIVNNIAGNVALTIGSGDATGGDYRGVIADNSSTGGSVSLIKTGAGTITLSGANTSTGTTIINEGTLLLGANNTLKQGSSLRTPVVLGGGTLNTGGFSEGTNAANTLGTLTLSLNSYIDLSTGNSSILRFADSSAAVWGGGTTLTIKDYSGQVYNVSTANFSGTAGDALYFGNVATGLTGNQLSQIQFLDPSGYTGTYGAFMNTNGEVFAAVPEPATILGGLVLVGVVGWRERCRLASLLAQQGTKTPKAGTAAS